LDWLGGFLDWKILITTIMTFVETMVEEPMPEIEIGDILDEVQNTLLLDPLDERQIFWTRE
jgi:hypothetical protein